jgi:hypothetical protein
MALKFEKNEYSIPRGRVFFNPLDPATDQYLGEIYLGNCPGFKLQIEVQKAEHYSSETGLRQKDDSTVLEVKRSASITCDNMNAANTALFLSGSTGDQNQSAGEVDDNDPEIITVIPGRTYQLGIGEQAVVGRRQVTDVVVKDQDDLQTYDAGKDYSLDAQRGILQILAGGKIEAGEIHVSYKYAACTWRGIRSGDNGDMTGALRVAADNAKGPNLDYWLPRVSLAPSGDLSVIADGTDYNQMTFKADVLKPASGEAVYVDGLPLT